MRLSELQEKHKAWANYNFGEKGDGGGSLHGAHEEAGELIEEFMALLLLSSRLDRLSHSYLKSAQGIRGTREEHQAKMKDAVGDTLIYLTDFCTRQGLNIEECADIAWDEIKDRDWRRFPKNGRTE